MPGVGELVLIVLGGSLAFSPKELPKIGRMLGFQAGRAVGYLQKVRSEVFQLAEKTDMVKVHEEIQETMHQLNAIRAELKESVNVFGVTAVRGNRSGQSMVAGRRTRGLDDTNNETEKQHDNVNSINYGSDTGYKEENNVPGLRNITGESRTGDQSFMLPVSASAVGLVPKRGKVPTGSEVLFDALQEERVARNAAEFMKQQAGFLPQGAQGKHDA
jgi:Sec-independent protein translocase protein TatA